MKTIFIILTLLISNISLAQDNTTLAPMNWKYQENIKIGTIRSSLGKLTKSEKHTIISKYNSIKESFFKFEDRMLCIVPPTLDLRIVSDIDINSDKYFDVLSKPGYTFFGRYFRDEDVIYITKEAALYHTALFAHELTHYFYDMCGVKFFSDDLEHDRIRMFQKFLGVVER